MTRRDITFTIPIYLPDLHRDVQTIRRTMAGVRTTIATWRARAVERRELAHLDDRLRRDIGAGPADVRAEASKPFWRSN